jgi:hypothetical protein
MARHRARFRDLAGLGETGLFVVLVFIMPLGYKGRREGEGQWLAAAFFLALDGD